MSKSKSNKKVKSAVVDEQSASAVVEQPVAVADATSDVAVATVADDTITAVAEQSAAAARRSLGVDGQTKSTDLPSTGLRVKDASRRRRRGARRQ